MRRTLIYAVLLLMSAFLTGAALAWYVISKVPHVR
jgi:hypothetical protein